MGTIFVAYGGPEHRTTVLKFAIEQATANDHDLLVYHVQESAEEATEEIREEIETVIRETAPDVPFEIRIDTKAEFSDEDNVSIQKRLLDAVLESDSNYEYVVMGDIQRGSIGELTHASLTEALLKTHAVPVMLVPV